MGGFLATFLFMLFSFLVGAGIFFLGSDFRHFNEIKTQCERHGYIQNETMRIKCSPEKPQ